MGTSGVEGFAKLNGVCCVFTCVLCVFGGGGGEADSWESWNSRRTFLCQSKKLKKYSIPSDNPTSDNQVGPGPIVGRK